MKLLWMAENLRPSASSGQLVRSLFLKLVFDSCRSYGRRDWIDVILLFYWLRSCFLKWEFTNCVYVRILLLTQIFILYDSISIFSISIGDWRTRKEKLEWAQVIRYPIIISLVISCFYVSKLSHLVLVDPRVVPGGGLAHPTIFVSVFILKQKWGKDDEVYL